MRCPKCGTELNIGEKYCRECGTKIDAVGIIEEDANGEREENNIPSYDRTPTDSGRPAPDNAGEDTPMPGTVHVGTDETDNHGVSDQSRSANPDKVDSPVPNETASNGNDPAGQPFERPVIVKDYTHRKMPEIQLKSLISVVAAIIVLLFCIITMVSRVRSSDSSRSSSSSKIVVIDVVGMSYSDAVNALQSAGFTKIESNVGAGEDGTLWIVSKQSVESGTEIRSNAKIELACVKKCKLYIDVSSEYNIIFGSYDITAKLDDVNIGTVENGGDFTYLADVLSGTHTLEFCKLGSASPSNSRKITVSDDMTYSCFLEHSGSSIYITKERKLDNIDGSALEVVDVTGMVLYDARSKLEAIGFTNVHSRASESIWNNSNWIVMKQSVASGTRIDKNALIELHCITLDKYFSDTFVGKNVIEIQRLAEAGGFSLTFQNSSGLDYNSTIDGMSQEEKADWVATSARQNGSSSKMALVKIKNSKEAEPTPTPAPTPAPTSKPTATPKPTPAPTPKAVGSTMPIMSGSSLDDVIAEAKKYGLSRAYSDEDFGHGTKLCALTTSNWGLTLDVIYSTSTKEILCGSIVTSNVSSAKEQKAFINGMANVLCPESDSTEVANWVKTNVGSSEETTISGFIYEVGLGPAGNCLYFAGDRNWEEWELSLD